MNITKNKKLFKIINFSLNNVRFLNANTAGITRTHRFVYPRTYPTTIVEPDGSSYTINFEEPRKIIKLPLDLSTLSESERKARMERRKPKQKIKIEDDFVNKFDSKKYLKYIKK